MDLGRYIRNIPDFPVPGILFRDITPLLQNPHALRAAMDCLAEHFKHRDINCIAAIESRGFIVATPLAYLLNVGFVPIRKAGKLPAEKIGTEYSLEYGTNRLEIHRDAILPGQKVLVVDDLLATGGSAKAAAELVEQLGGKVESFAFLIELESLKGREKLSGYEVFSLLKV